MSQLSLFSAEARPTSLADLGGLLCGPARVLRFGGGVTARISLDAADPGRERALRAAAAPFGLTFEAGGHSCVGRELRTAYRRDLAGLAGAWTDPTGPDHKRVPADFQLDGTALRLWVLAAGRPDGRGGYLLPLDGGAPGTHDRLIAGTTRLGLPPARVQLPRCPACTARADTETEPPEEPVERVPPPAPVRRERRDPADPDTLLDPDDLPVVDLHDLHDLPELPGPEPVTTCRTHHRTGECRAAGPALRITGARRMHRLVELVGPPPEGVDAAEWPRYWGRSRT
ncbi:hypothetical protein [Pseudonocardia sp. WMMC193]|uniref:hypothetical protein n=1 Tax=Pseudonocardia sp. WMMC193 TaxID=2911965 RepID=UPI001F4213CA|nr:hypothetical protein [Pseudonocardia sp. WMMC193]MCF7551629.1 hypothetical protein [Pseudonocardia sp. WMMC193]